MNKKRILVIFVTVILALVLPASFPAHADAPIQISTCQQLQDIGTNDTTLAGSYVLSSNIDCSATTSWNSHQGFAPIGAFGDPFTGTFDGQGYSINSLFMSYDTHDGVALFADVDSGATISNVRMANVNITVAPNHTGGGDSIAALVGSNSGTITNASSSGTVTADVSSDVGGLVGYNGGTITNSHSSVTVNAIADYVGGLVGGMNDGSITNSYATGNVSGASDYMGGLAGYSYGNISNSYATGNVSDGTNDMGGFVGEYRTGTITNCYATGNVGDDNAYYIGGFSGEIRNNATVTQSYATGDVISNEYGGGFTGSVETSATVSQSFATGNISGPGSYLGGFVGDVNGTITDSYARGNTNAGTGNDTIGGFAADIYNNGVVNNSYSTGTASGDAPIGGFVADIDNSITANNDFWDVQASTNQSTAGGMSAEQTSDMKTQSTFTNQSWDFSTIWTINDFNDGYPTFQWYSPPTDGDGVPTAIENAAPNNGDGNNDGIADSTQGNVVSFVNSVTGKYIVAVFDNTECHFSSYATGNGTRGQQPDIAFTYANGWITFTLNDCGTGATVNVKLYYYDINNAAFVLRKYTPSSSSYFTVPNASLAATAIAGHNVVTASYVITDGGLLDQDATVNDVIADPVGLGTASLGAPQTGLGGTAH